MNSNDRPVVFLADEGDCYATLTDDGMVKISAPLDDLDDTALTVDEARGLLAALPALIAAAVAA